MATRAVGLDIGTFAVRAVELSLGAHPTLLRYGQVTLPPGAVENGEIIDSEAVGAAIRRLWSEGGFRGRDVVIGVANQRVIVRQAELPAMDDAELRTALQFEAQDLIPFPVEDAVLDFQVLDQISSPDGEPLVRILLAAAQRDMIRTHVAAVERAGLSPSMIDLVPFALIRALARDDEATGAEALVSVGGGVTNVVVHVDGVPRFVRVLQVGGDDITQSIASSLAIDIDAAEDLKRRAVAGDPDAGVAEAARLVEQGIIPVVEEIRGSIDFYRAQSDSEPISRLIVTGGASSMTGLVERLGSAVGVPVELADPLAGLRIGRTGLSESQLEAARSVITVPVGLALARGSLDGRARRITLLPTEVAEVREQRRQMVLTGAGVGALFLALLLLWAGRGQQLSNARDEANQAEAQTAQLQQQVAALADATALDNEISVRQKAIRNVLQDDVAWTRLLQEIATVIPNDVWLTSFTGRSGPPGELQFSAMGFDQSSTARWLLRVSELDSIKRLWVPSSTKAGEQGIVTFSSTAELTAEAHSDRAERYTGSAQ